MPVDCSLSDGYVMPCGFNAKENKSKSKSKSEHSTPLSTLGTPALQPWPSGPLGSGPRPGGALGEPLHSRPASGCLASAPLRPLPGARGFPREAGGAQRPERPALSRRQRGPAAVLVSRKVCPSWVKTVYPRPEATVCGQLAAGPWRNLPQGGSWA